MSNLTKRVKQKILRMFPKRVDFSIGELMLQREKVSHVQFSISALLMDVENYCKDHDTSFYWQNVGQRLRHLSESHIQDTSQRFRSVIDSVLRDGYHHDSLLEVGPDVTLNNGSHRTALCLYIRNFSLSGKLFYYKHPSWQCSAAEFIQQMGFQQDYVNAVLGKYAQIQDSLIGDGISYCCLMDEKIAPTVLEEENGVHIKRTYRIKTGDKSVMGGVIR